MNTYDRILEFFVEHKVRLNENQMNALQESLLISKKDIYYNKDKFDSGEINLCFITGEIGSGKTTLARNLAAKYNGELYELDDVIENYRFSDDNLKEYGDLIYSFFKSSGKKYRTHSEEEYEKTDFDKELINSFIQYSMSYANSHKNRRYIIEGIWIYLYTSPNIYNKYAFIIKNTSVTKSQFRAITRAYSSTKSIKKSLDYMKNNANTKIYLYDEKKLKVFRDYFSPKNFEVEK